MQIFYEKKKLIAILVILISLGVVIMTYGLIMKSLFKDKMILKDFMNYKICDISLFGADCCSLWPFSHLILYAILAFIFPDCLIVLFIIGVVWELMEMSGDFIISKYNKTKKSRPMSQKKKSETSKVEYKGVWIQGNFKDILFNVVGIAIGFGLRKAWDAQKKKQAEKQKQEINLSKNMV